MGITESNSRSFRAFEWFSPLSPTIHTWSHLKCLHIITTNGEMAFGWVPSYPVKFDKQNSHTWVRPCVKIDCIWQHQSCNWCSQAVCRSSTAKRPAETCTKIGFFLCYEKIEREQVIKQCCYKVQPSLFSCTLVSAPGLWNKNLLACRTLLFIITAYPRNLVCWVLQGSPMTSGAKLMLCLTRETTKWCNGWEDFIQKTITRLQNAADKFRKKIKHGSGIERAIEMLLIAAREFYKSCSSREPNLFIVLKFRCQNDPDSHSYIASSRAPQITHHF